MKYSKARSFKRSKWWRFSDYSPLDDESGTVEAGLTLIPTTAFFLLVMQLVISGSYQVVEAIDLQNFASKSALANSDEVTFAFNNDREVSRESLQLPGGGELVLVRSHVKAPLVSSFISAKRMKSQTLAIQE